MLKKITLLFFISFSIIHTACKKKNANGAAQAQGAPLPVEGRILGTDTLDETLTVIGTVKANESVMIMPEIGGKIESIGFKEGERVSKGQVLFKINDAELRAQLKSTSAQRSLAAIQEKRLAELSEINGVSKQEYDAAVYNLKQLEAAEELIQAQIEKTFIRSPFNGLAGIRTVSPGAFVTAGQALVGIQETGPLKVDFTVTEKYASKILSGVEIKVMTSKDTLSAKLLATGEQIDANTRNLAVRAIIENHKDKLIAGNTVEVELNFGEIRDAIMVPTQAIVPVNQGKQVWLLKGGKANPAKVVTGIKTKSDVQVESGVSPGDTLIVTGLLKLRPGAAVKVELK